MDQIWNNWNIGGTNCLLWKRRTRSFEICNKLKATFKLLCEIHTTVQCYWHIERKWYRTIVLQLREVALNNLINYPKRKCKRHWLWHQLACLNSAFQASEGSTCQVCGGQCGRWSRTFPTLLLSFSSVDHQVYQLVINPSPIRLRKK